jgi:hypothetical protein
MLFATQCERDKSVHKGMDQIKKKSVMFQRENQSSNIHSY